MAKQVRAQVIGGTEKVLEADTVQDVANTMNCATGYTASVNGEPADMDQELNDYEYVSFTKAVKGGN